jgi:hypothetical protein
VLLPRYPAPREATSPELVLTATQTPRPLVLTDAFSGFRVKASPHPGRQGSGANPKPPGLESNTTQALPGHPGHVQHPLIHP